MRVFGKNPPPVEVDVCFRSVVLPFRRCGGSLLSHCLVGVKKVAPARTKPDQEFYQNAASTDSHSRRKTTYKIQQKKRNGIFILLSFCAATREKSCILTKKSRKSDAKKSQTQTENASKTYKQEESRIRVFFDAFSVETHFFRIF